MIPLMVFCSSHRVVALICLLLTVAGTSQAHDAQLSKTSADTGADVLLSASSDEHIWLVQPHLDESEDARPRLIHHALAMGGPFFSRGPRLPSMPEAIAAADDRVWLVFSPREVGSDMQREVFTVRMQRDPAMGLFHPVPRDRLARSESLPGWGRIASITAGPEGPITLIMPLDHETFSVRRDGKEAVGEVRQPQLWQMRRDRWVQVELPPSLQLVPGDPQHLLVDDDGETNLLTDGPTTDTSTLWQHHADGSWRSEIVAFDARTVRSLITIGQRPAVVTVSSDADDVPTARVAYLRGTQTLTLTSFDPPKAPWAAIGVRDGLHLLTQARTGELTIQRIDPVTGRFGQVLAMTDQPLPAEQLWHRGLMLAVSVIAVMIVLLVRPGPKSVVQLPKKMTIVPAVPRLVALVIDLLPGGVLAVLLMRAPPAELLVVPMLAETITQAGPHLIMLCVTFLHCTIVELITGTTLGKMLIGAGVASADGTRLSVGQVLVRNAVKLMVLIVPPLAVFALLNPYMQGFNDMAARTVVLRELEESVEQEQQ